jgi:hypothetical protein
MMPSGHPGCVDLLPVLVSGRIPCVCLYGMEAQCHSGHDSMCMCSSGQLDAALFEVRPWSQLAFHAGSHRHILSLAGTLPAAAAHAAESMLPGALFLSPLLSCWLDPRPSLDKIWAEAGMVGAWILQGPSTIILHDMSASW